MKISSVRREDKESIKTIVVQCFSESIELPESDKKDLVKHIFGNIEQNVDSLTGVFLKAAENEIITGFILIKEWWNLSDLFVSPKYHAKGIGRLLLSNAIEVCKKETDKDYIYVNSSINAEGFYRKYGFSDREVKNKNSEFIVPLKYIF